MTATYICPNCQGPMTGQEGYYLGNCSRCEPCNDPDCHECPKRKPQGGELKKMNYALHQGKIAELHALRAHAEIVSGAYKLREITDGAGRPLTDEEKLKDKVDEMRRHIRAVDQFFETAHTHATEQEP